MFEADNESCANCWLTALQQRHEETVDNAEFDNGAEILAMPAKNGSEENNSDQKKLSKRVSSPTFALDVGQHLTCRNFRRRSRSLNQVILMNITTNQYLLFNVYAII